MFTRQFMQASVAAASGIPAVAGPIPPSRIFQAQHRSTGATFRKPKPDPISILLASGIPCGSILLQ